MQEFFPDATRSGTIIRAAGTEFTVIGTFEKIGSVLGQDQDNFIVIPLRTYLKLRGQRNSLTLHVKAEGGEKIFDAGAGRGAPRAARPPARRRRARTTTSSSARRDSYISLWQSISAAFFTVFVMISSISAVVGGIVIMNVMLVSVTERTKEIGVRRAVGATQADVLRQFLTESVMQCLIGGARRGRRSGSAARWRCASLRRFPASVQAWVAITGRGAELGHRPVLRHLSGGEGVQAGPGGGADGRNEHDSARDSKRICWSRSTRCARARCAPALTILGIVIGVTSVICVAAIIDGLNGLILSRINSFGSRSFFMTRIPPGFRGIGRLPQKIRMRKYLETSDAQYLKENVPGHRHRGGVRAAHQLRQRRRPIR